jgi:hypothetical protein
LVIQGETDNEEGCRHQESDGARLDPKGMHCGLEPTADGERDDKGT